MKRNKFFDIAEKMYVEQFITEEEIAKRIGVCDRTIRRWKALGDWGIKRDGFLKANTISKDAMYSLASTCDIFFNLSLNPKMSKNATYFTYAQLKYLNYSILIAVT